MAMQPRDHLFSRIDGSSGVSEIIGAILLIALVVTGAALISVFLFSQPTPKEIPNINFMTGSDSNNNLFLYHNGGDALNSGEFDVIVDGTPRSYQIVGGGSEWSLGKNLKITNIPSGSHTVAIMYNSSSAGSVLIRSASANISSVRQNINPELLTPSAPCISSDPVTIVNYILNNVSLIGDAMNQSPSTVGPVIANVVGANSISFYKDNRVDLADTGANFFRIKVTKSGSSISVTQFGGSPVSLSVGDIVTVYLRLNTGIFKAFGLGDELWELSATGVDVNITYTNGTQRLSGPAATNILHSWITGYSDLGSTLTILTDTSHTSGTALVVNGTQWINGDNNDNVVITNIRPVGIGLFLLEGDNNAHIVYFVGNAQSVTRNGVPVV